MDWKDPFSRDSVNTIRGIGREWALPCRHDPPRIRKHRNRDREKERRPPDPEQKPPPATKDDAEGFEIIV